jgi:hypothetical protein
MRKSEVGKKQKLEGEKVGAAFAYRSLFLTRPNREPQPNFCQSIRNPKSKIRNRKTRNLTV